MKIKNIFNFGSDSIGSATLIIFRFLLLGCLVFYVALAFAYTGGPQGFLDLDQNQLGPFGDFVGGLANPFISFCALLALFYTILQNGKELRHTSDQLKSAAEAAHTQNKHWEKQAFENTFFQLFGVYREVVNGFETEFVDPMSELLGILEKERLVKKVKFIGKKAIARFFGEFRAYIPPIVTNDEKNSMVAEMLSDRYGCIVQGWDQYCKEVLDSLHLVHYLDTVCTVVEFIARSSLTKTEKKFYFDLFRRQFSQDEYSLIFYDCCWFSGEERVYKKFLVELGFFVDAKWAVRLPQYEREVFLQLCSDYRDGLQ